MLTSFCGIRNRPVDNHLCRQYGVEIFRNIILISLRTEDFVSKTQQVQYFLTTTSLKYMILHVSVILYIVSVICHLCIDTLFNKHTRE
ncbi:hypothetical protein AR158_c350R [Paramecium bursaria Chlorella virus AR158]|uniref:hypothetical protein n=1 Tax=Paramecium bursaria Chlorella virus AR158 TaxID=380598 RepID=UPI00015AA945|nr:hypothetical protein AR158_c350R [Paramecium bursaria Chlorella virus AR158]ABU43895.1 hypothetical protein AR158_c350R [Paramecium bursaria Chlorella virus AR158]